MIVLIFLSIFPGIANATYGGWEKKLSHVAYYKNIFGHIHKSPSRYSQSLSTIECNRPVKVFVLKRGDATREIFGSNYRYVKVGNYVGHINQAHLSPQKTLCFQERFPKFFDMMALNLTDMYYWGKLYDQYIYGKSRAK